MPDLFQTSRPLLDRGPGQAGAESLALPAPVLFDAAGITVQDVAGRATILLVDGIDINRQLVRGILKAAAYRIIEARDAGHAMGILARERVDLIIADLIMPEQSSMNGLEFCRALKANRRTRLIPILILTSVRGIENEIAMLDSGADEFLIKPLQPTVMRSRVRSMLRGKRTIDSLEEAETILFALAQAVEYRDKATGNHCQRLASLGVALGAALGLPEDDLIAIYRGGFLHDIGKIAVPDSILFKPGKLDDGEWAVMRLHPAKGEEICRPMRTLMPVLPIIRSHHERWDGGGYPDGLAGESIPLTARILQLVDIYDALTSQRSYKSALSPEASLELIRDEASRGWRDPELVSVFSEMLRQPEFISRAASLSTSVAAAPGDFSALQSMRDSLAHMSRQVQR